MSRTNLEVLKASPGNAQFQTPLSLASSTGMTLCFATGGISSTNKAFHNRLGASVAGDTGSGGDSSDDWVSIYGTFSQSKSIAAKLRMC